MLEKRGRAPQGTSGDARDYRYSEMELEWSTTAQRCNTDEWLVEGSGRQLCLADRFASLA